MIILDGKTDKELGIRILESYEHPEPATKDKTVEIPGKHGEYDLGADIGPLPFNFPILLEPQIDRETRNQKIKDLKNILFDHYGRPRTFKLIFEDFPDRFYMVRYSGSFSVHNLLTLAQFTLPLTAFDPVAKFIVPSDEIIMDSDIPILSDITLDAIYKYEITSNQSVNIINDGSIVARPTILITGSADLLTLSANGKSFSIGQISSPVEINGENYTVKVNGLSNLSAMTGDFIELFDGDNEISITGTNMNLTIIFRFYHQYI
jgi:phage-related protein